MVLSSTEFLETAFFHKRIDLKGEMCSPAEVAMCGPL